ncbi:hypothetical protein QZH41_016287 [Actinostola sp. cb2023]|nr:hypothetical protein QZH41_016287 [Actinostola sp. cb2023]
MSLNVEIGSIAPFDCKGNPTSVGPRWTRWKRSFEYYVEAKGIDKDPQRKALLLHCAGLEVQDVYDTLTDPGPVGEDDKEYDKVMRTLDHHFSPQVNVPFERHQFRQAGEYTITANVDPVFLGFLKLIPDKNHVEKLSEVNVGLLNMTTGSYKVVDKPLKMGQLSGDAFRIVIRDVHQNEGIHKRVVVRATQGCSSVRHSGC